MPVSLLHGIEYLVDECAVDVLMEEVAHRVHEDHARLFPKYGLLQSRRPECQVKTLLVGVSDNPAPALCEALGVAVVTTRTYLGAARHRVPGCVGPFDFGFLGHLLRRTSFGQTNMPSTRHKAGTAGLSLRALKHCAPARSIINRPGFGGTLAEITQVKPSAISGASKSLVKSMVRFDASRSRSAIQNAKCAEPVRTENY